MTKRLPAFVLVAGLLPAASTAQGLIPFGPEFQVNSYTTGLQMYSAPVFAPDGAFVVVWGSDAIVDGGPLVILGQRYDAAGARIGPEFLISTHAGFASHPDVASDAMGRFTVAWTGRGDDGAADIFARRYDATGVPLGPDFRVNTYTTQRQGEPSIASDAAGRTVIVWDGPHENGGSTVYGQRYAPDGQTDGSEFQVDIMTRSPHQHATVASDSAGNFMVVWNDTDIFAQRYDTAAAPAGGTFRVNDFTTSTQHDAFVAADPGGNFVVVWSSQLESWPAPAQVVCRRYDPSGTPVGAEFRVNSVTTGPGGSLLFPAVSSSPDGGFMVVWTWHDEDGSGRDIRGQTYDPAGSPIGGEFRVTTETGRSSEVPFIAASPDGDFLVTWTSWPDDFSNGDIFARRYRTDLIFADGFESGSLDAWSSSATGGGDLTVSADAAAKLTANGLSGAVDDTAPLFVQDASPRDEPRYRARFHFDTNSFDPGEADNHFRTRIFIAFEEAPTRRLAAIVLRRQGGAYSLIGRARLDDGTQADTPPVPIAGGPHFVEIDWRRSGGPDANDGAFEMWIDGTAASTLSSLDNSLSAVDFVRLGALSVKSGGSGTMYWDEFESRRASYIGP